jgi:hypothetical protein
MNHRNTWCKESLQGKTSEKNMSFIIGTETPVINLKNLLCNAEVTWGS